MNIPINGRIAIIDDQIEQALPIINVLSKRQMPLTYFSGELKFLPEDGENLNDIRVLFLDINLIDSNEHEDKVYKSSLIPVLERVISKENYPYVLIYWSRHERHKLLIKEEIFNKELKDRKPIGYLSASKSDYFNLDDTKTDDFETKIEELFEKIESIINRHTAYSHLINWENQVHLSADATLQNIFSFYEETNWDNNANYILHKLGEAYLGKHHKGAEIDDKIKGSFNSLSIVFKDTLEYKIRNQDIINNNPLKYTEDASVKNINALNISLNIVRYINDISESGNVVKFINEDPFCNRMLHKIISFYGIKISLKNKNPDISDELLKKETENNHDKIKKEIKKEWIKIGVVVTPVCDFAQNNIVVDRIVKGLMIPKKYQPYIESNSEAVYTIPFTIKHDDIDYLLVLDFRYFVTTDLTQENVSGLFRIRQELLSEIQSKLSRHINRQGILLIDER